MRIKWSRVFILCVIFLIIGVGVYLIINKYNSNKLISDIKNHYSKSVLINKNSNLYILEDDKYKPVITLKEEISLNLDDVKEFDIDTKYFKIKGTEYYAYYKNCKEFKGKTLEDNYPSFYLLFNNNIKTADKAIIYDDSNIALEIDKQLNLPLIYMSDDYYFTNYLGKIYGIKKSDGELEDSINTEEKESNFISVIHYKNISDSCDNKDCIDLETIENNLIKLSENKNYTINIDDYNKWNKGYIRLKENAVLIVVDDDSLIKNLFDKYNYNYIKEDELDNVKLMDDNKTTKMNNNFDNLSSYLVYNKNSDDIFDKLLLGEDYVTKKEEKDDKSQNYQNNNIVQNNQYDSGNASSVAVLNYHFFYDTSQGQTCGESICLEASIFENQLKYLRDNNYKTLTIEEFRAWMYGEIEIPKKSVLLTVDDGAKGTGINNGNVLIPLLEKYQAHATLFLISGWWGPDDYRSDYLDIQSHTWDMHREGYCNNETRGSQLLCSSYEEILNDLEHSINDVDSNTAFCFPFYAYNDKAIKAIKEKGFKIAFIGGGHKATRNVDKYLIPRYVIYDGITLNQFINYIN